MEASFALRRHPTRFLYSDWALRGFLNEPEIAFFHKDWGAGPIFDVGASVGKYTTILAKSSPRAVVYAFEPNLNSLYYLAHRAAGYPNIVVVPNALTIDGKAIKGTYEPDYNATPTGPSVATMSLNDALLKFGVPTFIKMDIEGGEFEIFDGDVRPLQNSTILVSWHLPRSGMPVPTIPGWVNKMIAPDISLLEPQKRASSG